VQLLGYQSGVKGYKLWNPQTQKVVISRNVIFNESVRTMCGSRTGGWSLV
jgi:hypothetical protein